MPLELTVDAVGTVTAAGAVVGAAGTAIPLAFASVSWNGVMQSGTHNVATAYNSATKRYEITITGVAYDRLQFTALAVKSGYSNSMSFLNTDSANGKLLVDVRDVNGNLKQDDFGVVVFQHH
jgi:hypothetical protein